MRSSNRESAMPSSTRSWDLGSIVGLFALVASCLPGDTRPVPGNVTFSVDASDATKNGFSTSDGWTIHFDRLLTAVGDVGLNDFPDNRSTSCNEYSTARYDRFFDFTQVRAPAKLGLIYGLGSCEAEYRVRSPSSDSILEAGTTPADLAFMRTQGTDAFETDARVTLRVQGQAEKDGRIERFDWSFRRSIQVSQCKTVAGDGFVDAFDLRAKSAITLRAVMSGEELFRQLPADDAPLVFDLVASADADGDGSITFDELAKVDAPPSDLGTGGSGSGDSGPNPLGPPKTMADLVYDWLLPRVSRIAGGGPCDGRPR